MEKTNLSDSKIEYDSRPHSQMWVVLAGVAVCAAFLLSLRVGRYPLSLHEIALILAGGNAEPMDIAVFFNLRLPRTVMALLAGAGLGFAGSVFQLVFKNPLASPDIIGVSSGASLGAAAAIVLFGQSAAMVPATAFTGAMLVLLLVIAVAKSARTESTVTYILAGIIMKAVSDSLIMTLKYFADPESQLASIEYWAMGSLGNITAGKLYSMLPFFLFGLLGLIIMRRQIFMLCLNDDESRSLGVRVGVIRTAVLALCALLVASVISQTGLIAFAALIAPHAARLALRRTNFSWCVLSALFGAFILLVSDMLARSVTRFEIPISIPTTLIGVPLLLYFMLKRGKT